METFAIITVEPNELVARTTHHDRMPLVVRRSDWQRWLEPCSDEQPPVDLLRPFDSELMKAWRSDAAINSVRNTGPELGAPVKGDNADQPTLF